MGGVTGKAMVGDQPMLTKEDIKKIVATMREHQIQPRVIQTAKEAREATAADPSGHQWKVGEAYYLMCDITGHKALATGEG